MNTLRYAEVQSDIGPIFLAATSRGLCGLRLSHDTKAERQSAVSALGKRVGADEVIEDPAALRGLAEEVREVIAGRRAPTSISLDIPGTEFQRKVWKALVRVPWGKTVTYAQLAGKAGNPGAVRA